VSEGVSLDDVRVWATTAARAASDKQGQDTIVLAVGEILAITDAFVITTGANPRQVRTICEAVEEAVKLAGGPAPIRIEGLGDASWVLIDYGDFVVHVMSEQARGLYALERLWADGELWAWDERQPAVV
jgi:ribosome-associated protein